MGNIPTAWPIRYARCSWLEIAFQKLGSGGKTPLSRSRQLENAHRDCTWIEHRTASRISPSCPEANRSAPCRTSACALLEGLRNLSRSLPPRFPSLPQRRPRDCHPRRASRIPPKASEHRTIPWTPPLGHEKQPSRNRHRPALLRKCCHLDPSSHSTPPPNSGTPFRALPARRHPTKADPPYLLPKCGRTTSRTQHHRAAKCIL